MKNVTLLVLNDCNLTSIENPRRAFLTANNYLQNKGKPPIFQVFLAGLQSVVSLDDGMYSVRVHHTVPEIDQTDLIIIPAFGDNWPYSLKTYEPLCTWIRKQYAAGAEIASLCVGAFLLAQTGLLNGKTCSTHWRAMNTFQKMFPEIRAVTEKILTDENGIYTSGGAFSSANLILYLIEKYAGRDTAIYCSKIFQVDMERNTQSPFIIFYGQKDHQDECVRQAQIYLEENFDKKISVDALAKMLAIGRRNFERRFKKATANTIMEYLQRVKIEAAKMSLESSNETVSEIMYRVGYSDTKAFRTTFKKFTGLSPIEYRRKYQTAFKIA